MPAVALKGKKKAVMTNEEEMQEEEMREGSEEEEPMEVKDTMKSAKKKKGTQDCESCQCKHNKGRKKMDSLTAGMFRRDNQSKKCGASHISAAKVCRQNSNKKGKGKTSTSKAKANKLEKIGAMVATSAGVAQLTKATLLGQKVGVKQAKNKLALGKELSKEAKASKKPSKSKAQKRKPRTYAKGFNVDYSRLDVTPIEGSGKKCGAGFISKNKTCRMTKGSVKTGAFGKKSNKEIRQIEENLFEQSRRTKEPTKISNLQAGGLILTPGTSHNYAVRTALISANSKTLNRAIKNTKNTSDPEMYAVRRLAKRERFNRRARLALSLGLAGAGAVALTQPKY